MRFAPDVIAIAIIVPFAACTPAKVGGLDAGATVPGAPTGVTAAAGDQSASVEWTAPASDGGLAIVGYTVLISPATPAAVVVVNGTRAFVSSLTNGTAYTFQVYATNAAGNGPPSAPSAPVTPTATPAAPVNLTYSDNPAVYRVNSPIAPNTPSNAGGAIETYSVTPALPAGLSLDPVTGVITGTPTAVTAVASYQVTGSNPSGSASASLSITVTTPINPGPPTLVQSVSYGGNAPTRGPPSTHYTFPMPNRWGAGNCVIVFLDLTHGNTVSSLTDDAGNSWPTSPAVSADAGSGGMVSGAFVLPNVNGGGRTLTLNLTVADNNVKVMVQEWAGIALSSPVGATAASHTAAAPTITLPSMTVGANSVLLHYAVDNTGLLGSGAPVASMTAGAGWTLQHADLAAGDPPQSQNMNFFGLQSMVAQSTTITPAMTTTGAHTVNTYCLELKAGPGAGTPVGSGIRVLKMAFVTNIHITVTQYPVPWPTAGNLIVVIEDDGSLTTAPTDSNGNTYAIPVVGNSAPQSGLVYAKATPNPSNVIDFAVTGASNGSPMNTTYWLLDIVGADPVNPFVQSAVFPVTSEGTSWTGTPVITPQRANGVVFSRAGTGIGPILTQTSPTGAYYVSVNFTGENDGDSFGNAGASSVYYYGTDLTQQSYGYTIANPTSISAVAAEFAAPP